MTAPRCCWDCAVSQVCKYSEMVSRLVAIVKWENRRKVPELVAGDCKSFVAIKNTEAAQ